MSIIPHHIAFIPDGNRRWASMRSLSPWQGHEHGSRRFRDTTKEMFDAGAEYVTFWAASYDNLKKRTKVEVDYLYKILRTELSRPQLIDDFVKNNIRVKVVGMWRDLVHDKKLIAAIENMEHKTAKATERRLTILFAYDGKREMLDAVHRLAEGHRINEQSLRKHLWTADLPDVDLVVRTGGEPHWSAGFMMWLTADSQFHFTNLLWPDFDKKALKEALRDYSQRIRRRGK